MNDATGSMYERLFNMSGDMLCVAESAGCLKLVNKAFRDTLGYTSEELCMHPFMHFVHPDDVQPTLDTVAEIVGKGAAVINFENRYRCKDGSYKWLNWTATPVLEEGLTYATARDVTEIKQATENALLDKEKLLAEAQRIARMGNWSFDMEAGELYWSDEIYRIFGCQSDKFTPSHEAFYECVHPDDRDAVRQSEAKSLEKHEPNAIDHRIVRPDGTIRWVHEETIPIFDDGQLISLHGIVQDVTERKEAEHEKMAAQQRMQDILDYAPAAIYVKDLDGRFTFLNQVVADLHKMPREEIVGKSLHDILPEDIADAIQQNDLEVIKTKKPLEIEERAPQEDGLHHYISIKFPLFDGEGNLYAVGGVSTDITERVRAEESLRISQQRLLLHRDQSPVGVIEWNTDFEFLDWNPAAEKIFGFTKEEVEGVHITKRILPESARAAVDKVWADLLENKGGFYSLNENTTKDGRTILCEWHNTPLVDHEGKVIGVTSLVDDVTQRQKNEDDLRQHRDNLQQLVDEKTTDLRAAKETAEKANQAKSEFLSNMSHEIRTPMNAIIGMSHLALQTTLDSKQRNYVEKVNDSAEGLLRIINDILDFSKIESGKLDVDYTDFRLEDVIDSVTQLITLKSDEKAVALAFEIDPAVPTALHGDQLRLRQILTNLASNAVKFTNEGGEIRIGAQVEESKKDSLLLHFQVTDTGIGMTEEQIGNLFQSFSQADSSITRQFGGTGLGLVICKRLTEMMGGKIWVESSPNVGSTFHFTVRIKQQTGTPSPRCHERYDIEQESKSAIAKLQGARVLLVEDNELNQELAMELLTSNGIQVETANNGKIALEMLANTEFNGVLMDCQMPVMDGYTATREIRQQDRFRETPIIAMTANTMRGDREKVLEAGMNDYIAKPINIDDMFSIMAKWITPSQVSDASGTETPDKITSRDVTPEGSVTDDELARLPGIDIEAGLAIVGGRRALLRKIMFMALDQFNGFECKFREAQVEKDAEAIIRHPHSLKTIAANIGARTVQQAALELETACITGDGDIDSKLAAVLTELQPVIEGLQSLKCSSG